jgi:hypothetical protein
MSTSSCLTYQYVTLTSHLNENTQKEFTFENDSLMIRYNFNGASGPVKIYIENKLSAPLYVDWKRSAIIQNNQSQTYWQDESTFQGTAERDSYYTSTFSADIIGTVERKESITFLPPRSFQETQLIKLNNTWFTSPDPKVNYEETMRTPTGLTKIYYYDFDKENSPIHFRSFLTLSSDPFFKEIFTVDHEFWASEIVESWMTPESFNKEAKDGNLYYLYK